MGGWVGGFSAPLLSTLHTCWASSTDPYISKERAYLLSVRAQNRFLMAARKSTSPWVGGWLGG